MLKEVWQKVKDALVAPDPSPQLKNFVQQKMNKINPYGKACHVDCFGPNQARIRICWSCFPVDGKITEKSFFIQPDSSGDWKIIPEGFYQIKAKNW